MARPNSPNKLRDFAVPQPASAMRPCAISDAFNFFEDGGRKRVSDPATATGSTRIRLRDPERHRRLVRIVKLTMALAAAIGTVALLRVALDGHDKSEAAAASTEATSARGGAR